MTRVQHESPRDCFRNYSPKNTISSASRYAKQTAPAVLLTLKSGA